jgi:glutaredoxin 2
MPRLYHFWSSFESQRLRLALSCKDVHWVDHPVAYDDDETFFELGVARRVPLLILDSGARLDDSARALWELDRHFPQGEPLVRGRLDRDAWNALLDWRRRVEPVLARLYAPLRPVCRDIAANPEHLSAYKVQVERRFGLGVEALANDRYAGFDQLCRLSRLPELARHLGRSRFYLRDISIADMLLTADLFPLQLHDGLSLPVDLMYYLERVQTRCNLDLRQGFTVDFA